MAKTNDPSYGKFLQRLSDLNLTELKRMQKDSLDWYRRQMISASQIKASSVTNFQAIANDPTTKLTVPTAIYQPGSLYLFRYFPKHSAVLPYYDEYPLILFLKRTRKGFYGINFHYASIRWRAYIFDKIDQIATAPPNRRVAVPMDALLEMSQLYPLKALVKMYLPSQVRSRMLKIDPKYWETALYLPVQQFRKAPDKKVWGDTNRNITRIGKSQG